MNRYTASWKFLKWKNAKEQSKHREQINNLLTNDWIPRRITGIYARSCGKTYVSVLEWDNVLHRTSNLMLNLRLIFYHFNTKESVESVQNWIYTYIPQFLYWFSCIEMCMYPHTTCVLLIGFTMHMHLFYTRII